jgi:hypothetical protein
MICVLGRRRCEKAETRANIFNWYELFARQSRGKVPLHVLLYPFLSDYNPVIQAVNDKLKILLNRIVPDSQLHGYYLRRR